MNEEEAHGSDLAVIDQEGQEIGLRPLSVTPALSVDELVERQRSIVEAMQRAMKENVHYGKIPGVNKPTLLKPGAEMLGVMFQLAPMYPEERQTVERDPVSGHLDVRSLCVLKHIPSGLVVAEGMAFASTREKKYAYRQGALVCPECGAAEIRKSKQQGKDEFYCWRKQGGCGATFAAGMDEYATFVEQSKLTASRVPNPDLPDTYNTVLKMGAKRALIAATLNATGASDVFTQDVEDMPGTPQGQYDSSTRPPVVRDAEIAAPDTWPKLTEAFEKAGVDKSWLSQAIEAGFGKPTGELKPGAEKREALQLLRTCYVLMIETLGAQGRLEFPGPNREELRATFAASLDGQVLEGPTWRMGQDETDRPEREKETA